jgi:pilus assembly protein CpaF
MRPDRLIVGEIRLPKEAFYTLQALHTGHDGSATTIHASSAEDALFRLELLARQSMRDLTVADLRTYIARVFDLVIVLRRLRSGRRIVRQIAGIDGVDSDGYRLTDLFNAAPAPGGDEVRFERDTAWQPSVRLQARFEAEGERWT